MSVNTLVQQTVSCFDEILKFLTSLPDNHKPESTYLCSLVTSLLQEWRQLTDSEGHTRDRRQLSDHVVSSKRSFENTLERVRRSTKIEGKGNTPPSPVPPSPQEDTSPLFLSIPEGTPRAPTLPPRNLTRGNVIRDKKHVPRKNQLLKTSSSCCDLGIEAPASVRPNAQTQRETVRTKHSLGPPDAPLVNSYDSHLGTPPNSKCLTPDPYRGAGGPISSPPLVHSYDSHLGTPPNIKCPTPEPYRGTIDSPPPKIRTARSCDDIIGISCEEMAGESTLLTNSLRSSYVKFKTRNGKWGKMYITMVGKNIYVSRNYADDQTELVYSLEDLDIVPKDEGRSKHLIQLKNNNNTQCSISIKSAEIRDDWYKAMVRAKYKPKSKSPVTSVEVSPTEHGTNRDHGIYVSPNSVDPSAARNLGIKVVIRTGTGTKGCEERDTGESEYLELRQEPELENSGDYVIHSLDENAISDKKIEAPYISLSDFIPFLYNGKGLKECALTNGDNTCEERNYYYLQN